MAEEYWVPPLAPKQLEVFNCFDRYVLCAGGRRNGKSIAVGHKAARHLWEIPGARVGLVAKTIRSAKEGGAWTDMIEIIMPQWLDAGIVGLDGLPLEYTTKDGSGTPGPRMDSATRTSSFKIRNYWGGESEMILISLDNEEDAEAKFRSLRLSMIWFSELQNFLLRKVFKEGIQQLRMYHLRRDQHQFIADSNPAEEGTDSWIYKLWYEERIQKTHPEPNFQKSLRLFEFHIEDNPFLDPGDIEELKGSNSDNQGDYDRNVLGIWSKGFGLKGKLFGDLFIPNKHIISPAIDIPDDTVELYTGWDIGQVNNSFHILERRMIQMPTADNKMTWVSHWLILEELITIGEEIGTEEFAIQCYMLMCKVENYKNRNFIWTHWSDDTAHNVFRASIQGYDAGLVLNATQGAVNLLAADKPKESVNVGTRIIRRLLMDNRLFVGGNCPVTAQMLSDISERDLETHSHLNHPFDSLRYPIYMEERKFIIMGQKPVAKVSYPTIHL